MTLAIRTRRAVQPALAAHIAKICESAPGFDRAAFHQHFDHDVTAFFAAALEAK